MLHVLLDEDVPAQLVEPLRHLVLSKHQIAYVNELRIKGTKDIPLLKFAARELYDAIVTADTAQFNDPSETEAIKASGLHHIRFGPPKKGIEGLALTLGALIAALPRVLDKLEGEDGQRLVKIAGLDPGVRRYEIVDPSVSPPAYWRGNRPRRQSR